MTPTSVITALEKALEEATPGQWAWEEGSDQDDMPHLMSQGAEVCNFGDSARYYPTEGSPPNEADAAYIAACSPLAIRVLLDAHASAVADSKRLDWLETQGYSYGFEDTHEGNRWTVEGPYNTVRKAIDDAMAALTTTKGGTIVTDTYLGGLPPLPEPAEWALQLAAQAWCEPTTSNIHMDDELATVFARMLTRLAASFEAGRASRAQSEWQPIETAPQTGRTLLLGYFNALGKWRTLRGQWFSDAVIQEEWTNSDVHEAGWFETSVECDDEDSGCWPTDPTHWQPLPTQPATLGDSK